jgi:hypothetical protein
MRIYEVTERTTAYNSTYKKLAVQCYADTLVVNENWFSAIIFVLPAANFL